MTAAALALKGLLASDISIPARVPSSMVYPGGVSSADYYNASRFQNQSSSWDPYDLFAMCSTQAMVPVAGVYNSTDENFLTMHMPLNQFAIRTKAGGTTFFSEFNVVRELHNITEYHSLENGGYTRFVGVLEYQQLYILVGIETWDYTYETINYTGDFEWPFESVPPPDVNTSIQFPTGRLPAVRFSFDFINLGSEEVRDLSLVSFFKADLYYNETGNEQDYLNFTLDDEVAYAPDSKLLYAVDQNNNSDFHSSYNWTAMGFNATTPGMNGWEVSPSKNLLSSIHNGTTLSNTSSYTQGTDDPGWAMSWLLATELPVGSRTNFTGDLAFGVGNSSEDAIRRMNSTLYRLQSNTTQSEVNDLIAVQANLTRTTQTGVRVATHLLLMNSGTTEMTNTELWFIANYSSSSAAVELSSTIYLLDNLSAGGHYEVEANWVPIDAGVYSVGWIIGGISFYLTGLVEDCVYNNYLLREVFVYSEQEVRSHLQEFSAALPYRLPATPMTVQYPGDFAVTNFSVVTPLPLANPQVTVAGDVGNVVKIDFDSSGVPKSGSPQFRVQVTIVVPIFYRAGLYTASLEVSSAGDGVTIVIPLVFEVGDARGRVFYDGIHNLFGLDMMGDNSTSFSGEDLATDMFSGGGGSGGGSGAGSSGTVSSAFSSSSLDILWGERLDTIFGNYYPFRETFEDREPKGASVVQVTSGIDFAEILGSSASTGGVFSSLGGLAQEGSDSGGDGSEEAGGLGGTSISMESLMKPSAFLSFPQNLTTDSITYDLVKFFDLVVIPDPERAITAAEVGNLSQYVASGGNLLVLPEDSGENDWTSLDDLLHAFGMDIVGEDPGYQNVTSGDVAASWPSGWPGNPHSNFAADTPLALFQGVSRVDLYDPVRLGVYAGYGGAAGSVAQLNDYMVVSRYGEGTVVAIGDEDAFAEDLLSSADNGRFLSNLADFLLGQYYEFSFKESNTTLPHGEEAYFTADLQNLPQLGDTLSTDFFMFASFVNSTGSPINASIFGYEIPVMPFLPSNASAFLSYFDSSWMDRNASVLPGDVYVVVYFDNPVGVSEFQTIHLTVLAQEEPPGDYEVFEYYTPPYPALLDVIFLFIAFASLVMFWVYSSSKWKSRHRYVRKTPERTFEAQNLLDEFGTIVEQVATSIRRPDIPDNEKVRYILMSQESLKRHLRDIRAVARELGER
ncbi:MAG: DUF4350 domain-containing protein [Promethearchaeota archaeon]